MRASNPFSKGPIGNWIHLFCSKIEPSKINLKGSVEPVPEEDEVDPHNEKVEIEKLPLTPPQQPMEEIQISSSA